MRFLILTSAIVLSGLTAVAPARGQGPATITPESFPASPPTLSVPQRGEQPNLLVENASPTAEDLWSVDVILGLPTAVRAQRILIGGEQAGIEIEGLAGVDLIFPFVAAGARGRWAPLCGGHDALVLSPGFDAYLLYNILHNGGGWFGGGPEGIGLFAGDVDITWRHSFASKSLDGEAGVKLGAGISSAGNGRPVPIACVMFGCRF